MECSCCNKQDMVSMNKTVLGIDSTAFYNREQVSLHAFSAHIRPSPSLSGTTGNFVYLINKNYACIFSFPYGFLLHLIHTNKVARLFLEKQLFCFSNGHLSAFCLSAHHIAHHLLLIDHSGAVVHDSPT